MVFWSRKLKFMAFAPTTAASKNAAAIAICLNNPVALELTKPSLLCCAPFQWIQVALTPH
jgi:hypothetical protein